MTPKIKAAGLVTQAALDTADRQAHPTEQHMPMQACQQLFAELAVDNIETAKRLSAEIRDVNEEAARRDMGKQILSALRLYSRFSGGAMLYAGQHRTGGC